MICLSYLAAGQSWNDYYEAGSEALETADFHSARFYFEKCMESDSSVFDLNVKYAESLRLTKNYKKAEYYYEKVFKKDKGKLFPLGQFKYGEMLYMNGKYKLAVRAFKKFKRKKKKDVDDSFYKLAEQWVKSATYALTTTKPLLESELKEIPDEVNQGELQFSPLRREGTLYFSAYNEEGSFIELKEIYFNDSISNPISSIVVLGLNRDVDVGNITFGAESEVFFSCCKGDTCQVYSGQFHEGVISGVGNLRLFSDNSISVTQPNFTIKNGEQYLFFSSNSPKGMGGRDIWYSKLAGDSWQKPINLGSKINTPGEEVTPFYDGGKLFFSSNWHNGFGGFDVVFSEGWLAQWGEVKNPGLPINSSYHDLYYSYDSAEKKGWFASNRISDKNVAFSTCCSKIYSFQYPDSLVGGEKNYKDLEELNKYLPVTLYFHNDEPNPRTRLTKTEFNYLTTYEKYLDLIPEYKKENSKGTRGDEKEEAELDVEDFFELLVQKGVADLKLFSELLLKELETGKSVELEVKGYASPRAKTDYNENLSRRRINSLVNYLKEYGGGVFRPYLMDKAFNGARLTVVENPFGEEAAADGVSDALEDEKESIYSRAARLERKIEIRSVTFSAPELQSNEILLELGDLEEGELAEVVYTFKNETDQTIQLDSIISSCGCTVPKLKQDFIPAGESIEIILEFDTTDKFGFNEKRVVIYSSSFTEPKILTIHSFIH